MSFLEETPLAFTPLAQAIIHKSNRSPFFIEIGAMDGVQYDLMYPNAKTGAWDGLLIEHMPDMFEALKKNYEGIEGLIFENCAVALKDGAITMTRANPELIQRGIFPPEYLGMTTSVRKEAFFQPGKLSPEQEQLVASGLIEVKVPANSLQTLIEKHNISHVDLLMIDAEGMDWDLAKAFDWERFQPQLICLEYAHFTKDEKQECLAHFNALGYANAPCAVENLNRLFFDPTLVTNQT